MPTEPRVFLASRNAGKLAEMERILREHLPSVTVLGLDDVTAYAEPVEDQPSFAGNAMLKARAGLAATGLATLADDSGLCVEALQGMPGVLSARWAGPPSSENARPLRDGPVPRPPQDIASRPQEPGGSLVPRDRQDARNNFLLLAQLADVPDVRRGAHFVCAVAFAHPDGGTLLVEGEMPGRVIREVRGEGGFGYDVLFEADDHPGRTTAELTVTEKDMISHRGHALREIAPQIAQALG